MGGKGKNKSPREGMPTRNMTFEDAGDQGEFQGQKRPPKKGGDGKIRDGSYMDGLDENGEEKEMRGPGGPGGQGGKGGPRGPGGPGGSGGSGP